ncbi:MAG: sigma-70 family RNA polymerase sigma factor [Planctomycetes bacterium]|nr:sigma-70 family RNA polymerase sigma factor [Planctomycetota bacterium]
MDARSPTERLLAEADWARALAERLVNDAASADDLVQEAWIAALRRPPDTRRPLRPWLAEVLRNAARQLRRGDSRRARRESDAAQPERLPSAAQLVEKAEAQRMLVDAVLGLPEPERRAVLLRYFEGLSAAEIARRADANPATVRWHLQCGLARLREALDVRFDGDRRAWVVALVPLVGPPIVPLPPAPDVPSSTIPSAGTTALAAACGGLIVTKNVFLALTGAALLGFGLYVGLDRGTGMPDAPPALPAESSPHATVASTRVDPDPATATPAAERIAIPTPAPDAVVASVIGRCVDHGGAPLGDCSIAVTVTTTAPAQQLAEKGGPRTCGTARTGADGRFELHALLADDPSADGLRFELAAARDGLVPTTGRLAALVPGEVYDLGDIVLERGARIRARLVDTDSRPLDGVRVRVQAEIPRLDRAQVSQLWSGVSAADGAVSLRDDPLLMAGAWEVTLDDAFELLSPQRLVVPADADVVMVTFIARRKSAAEAIVGRVVDEDGAPAGGVRVTASGDGDAIARATTAADGTFTLFRVARLATTVSLCVPGDEMWAPLRSAPSAWGTRDVELVRRRATVIDLAVVDDAGQPIERFGVVVKWSNDPEFGGRIEHEGDHPGGRLRIGGLGRGGHAALLVWPLAGSHGLAAPRRLAIPDGGVVPVDVVVPRLHLLEVSVRTASGTPVRGSTVELVQLDGRPLEPSTQVLVRQAVVWNFRADLERWPVPFTLTQATTDAAGVATLLCPREPIDAGLRVTGADHVTATVEPLVRGASDDPIVVVVEQAGRIVGRVTPDGIAARFQRDLAGADHPVEPIGILLRPADSHEAVDPDSDAGDEVAADGTFEIAGVSPGRWEVLLTWWRPSGPGESTSTVCEPPLAVVTVASGATAEVELDLSPHVPAVVRGVVTVAGRPAPWARVQLTARRRGADGKEVLEGGLGGVQTDADGRFAIAGMLAGDYLLTAQPSDADTGAWLAARDWVHVDAGTEFDTTFALEARAVRVRILARADTPVVGRGVAVRHDAHRRAWLATTDNDGAIRVPDCGLGALRIRLLDDDVSDGPTDWADASARPGVDLEPVFVDPGDTELEVARRTPSR